MALDGQLAFAALSRSEDELTRLVEEERADLTTKRRRYEYMGSMYARGSEKISQTVVKATAVKKSADENHGQGPPQATRVRARNNPKAPPENAGPQDGNTNKMSAACSPTSSSPPCLSGQIWTRACVGTILGTPRAHVACCLLRICNMGYRIR